MVDHVLIFRRKWIAGLGAALVVAPLAVAGAQEAEREAASEARPAPAMQSPALREGRARGEGAPPVQAAPGPRAVPVPDQYRLNMMIRSTILALNHANLTGNYTVLRDLGAPGFQVANSAARLAEAFAPMRARKLDLSPILFYNPKLVKAPELQDNQFLRLTGLFSTQPEQVNFDLAFQAFAGQWRLAGIAVTTSPATAEVQKPGAAAALPAPPAAAPARAASPGAVETGGRPGANGEGARPVRIDLSEPAPLPARRPNVPAPARTAAVPGSGAEAARPAAARPAAGTAAESNPVAPRSPVAEREEESSATSPAGWRPQ